MSNLKIAVLYYSSTGANHQMAKWAEAAAESTGAEVRRRFFRETAPEAAIAQNEAWKSFHDNIGKKETPAELDDLEWADAIVFCVPTRYGNLPGQAAAFIDTTGGLWFNGKLANKVVTGITSAQNPLGGQESTLTTLYKTMMHWGAIIVPTGYTDQTLFAAGGNPAGTSATVSGSGEIQNADAVKAAITHQVKRLAGIAEKMI